MSIECETLLTYLHRTTPVNTRHHKACYRCECGREVEVREGDVRCGHTRSCGCKRAALFPVSDKPGVWVSVHGAEYEPWEIGDDPRKRIWIGGRPWLGIVPPPSKEGFGPC